MRLAVPAILCLAGLTALTALGVWQLSRAQWKDGVMAVIEARLTEAPVALPARPDPVADRYRAVRLTGRIAGEGAAVFSTWRNAGPGYRIVAPFETDDGRRVLLDRGFAAAPEDARVPAERVAVEGNLNWPAERESDPADGWEARDVPALAAALGTEPVMVVARATSAPGGVRPVPLDSEGIPDNHLGYAVQWFGLAAVWAGMAGLWFWRQRRGPRGEGGT